MLKLEKELVTLNKNQLHYLKRVNIIGILCLILGIIILVINLLTKVKWYEYITVGALFITGLVFIYTSNKMIIKNTPKKK